MIKFLFSLLFIFNITANAQLYNPPTIPSGTSIVSPVISGAGSISGTQTLGGTLNNAGVINNGFVSGTWGMNGTINLNNNVIPVSGTGVNFSGVRSPTTTSTTTVIKILNDKSYGAWTPSFVGSASSPSSITYSVQSGNWSKDQNRVCWDFAITLSAITGGGGNLIVSGFPYIVTAAAGSKGGGTLTDKAGWTTNGPDFIAATTSGGTHGMQAVIDLNTTIGAASISQLTSSTVLSAIGCYITSE